MVVRWSWLAFGVVIWWLLIDGLVTLLLPTSASSATPKLAAGEPARIRQPGIRDWPVPTTRFAFDEFQRGVRESDENAINAAFETSEWLAVNHGDLVRIVAVDGDVVEIELLEGSYAGRCVWLKDRQLAAP